MEGQRYTYPMKPIRAALLALACAMPALALAQWMWVDNSGRKVLSDQPPPMDIPARNILRQPGVRAAPASETAPAASQAVAAKPELAASRAVGKDKDLEAKKKAAEAAEDEKAKAREEENNKIRAENCSRAKQAKVQMDSGTRIARTNAKGEREILDDAARQVETKRIEGIIARECAAKQG
ncbi:DUF4124 domain-containing protein [Caenimonas koreensis]|nr:DUF4124 domain-containing protein [Caenimonas koreensis]